MNCRRSKVARRGRRSVHVPEEFSRGRASALDPVRYFGSIFANRFIEDATLGLIPAGTNSQEQPFVARIEPESRDIERMLSAALSPGQYYRSLTDSLYGFFRDCAQTVVVYGVAYLEAIDLVDEDGHMTGFELLPIDSEMVRWADDNMYQIIPEDLARQRGINAKIALARERVLQFLPPPLVRNELRDILDSLVFLSEPPPPEISLPSIRTARPSVPFDYLFHIQTQYMAIAEVTKAVGWNARGLFADSVLESYWVYRQLLFSRFRIQLRDGILNTLNAGVEEIGKLLGFSSKILLNGLPTESDVDEAMRYLQEGSRGFEEILKPFLRY
jgi:hypothetical protein